VTGGGAAQGPEFRAGYAALLGEPNAGKSTLLNGILGQKLSIVTPKPQTTRHRILGIHSGPDFQIVFVDTPGIITPRYLLQELMMQHAASAVADADVVVLVLDALHVAPRKAPVPEHVISRIREGGKPSLLALNKIDLLHKPDLLPLMERSASMGLFEEIIPLSALTGDGTDRLIAAILRRLPFHPPYYPPDIVSEHPERFFVSEIIREKVFLTCHEEIPYSASVDIVDFKERQEGKWFVSADIYVERDSQKGMVIGARGAKLKEIGKLARTDIERFLEHPVFLELHVKVRERWREKEEWLQRLGYH
jgi:GTP-binding protein Era